MSLRNSRTACSTLHCANTVCVSLQCSVEPSTYTISCLQHSLILQFVHNFQVWIKQDNNDETGTLRRASQGKPTPRLNFQMLIEKEYIFQRKVFKPLNTELNPICYLLALLGAHHFLHVSRIRVKSLTLRPLMSYIYMEHLFLMFLDHTQRRTTVGRTPLDE